MTTPPIDFYEASISTRKLAEIMNGLKNAESNELPISEIVSKLKDLTDVLMSQYLAIAEMLLKIDHLETEKKALEANIQQKEWLLQYTKEHFNSLQESACNEGIYWLQENYNEKYPN